MTIHITPATEKAYKAYLDEVIDHDFHGAPILRRSRYPYEMEPDSGLLDFAAGYQAGQPDSERYRYVKAMSVQEFSIWRGAFGMEDSAIDAAIAQTAPPAPLKALSIAFKTPSHVKTPP